MDEDFLPDPNVRRSVENPGESSSGGGHRFLLYGRPGSKQPKGKKKYSIGAPVKLNLSENSLADDIVEVHNNLEVKKKVEELGNMIEESEKNNPDDVH